MTPRYKPLAYGGAALLAAWLLALGGFAIAQRLTPTAERVRAYIASLHVGQLSHAERLTAFRRLGEKLNALSAEERRKLRLQREWAELFAVLTEDEKAAYLDATLPSGFKQMITAFEALAPDKRRRAIMDAVTRLREDRETLAGDASSGIDTNTPVLSEDLQKKVITTGLTTFYNQSSAEAKAELAPVLEEIQRNMEKGGLLRGRRPLR